VRPHSLWDVGEIVDVASPGVVDEHPAAATPALRSRRIPHITARRPVTNL